MGPTTITVPLSAFPLAVDPNTKSLIDAMQPHVLQFDQPSVFTARFGVRSLMMAYALIFTFPFQ